MHGSEPVVKCLSGCVQAADLQERVCGPRHAWYPGPRERGLSPMTFKVGETVVYPHHGAALIEEIKVRKIKGEDKKYLVLKVA
ncbi:CarD family transcriptional regulator, partial [Escherichia coli]|uniref:CarD family transcriptional regulator n=1 Tax=Escherichia coli TaxID=562 RepID=UPI003F7A9B4A